MSLDELFTRADIVTIHAAINEKTEGMITKELLQLMKPSAFFVNLARAELVDYDALGEILKAKKIAGAAIDVFMQEPPQKDEPLLNLDNVLATPHIGGATFQVVDHQSNMIVSDFEAYLAGKRPRWIFNTEVLRKEK